MTKSHAQIQEGKVSWERLRDKSMIDYLDKQLTSSYEDLQALTPSNPLNSPIATH